MRYINVKVDAGSVGLMSVLLIASIGLGGCGSASHGSSSNGSFPSTATQVGTSDKTTVTPDSSEEAHRIEALVACMQRNGIDIPAPDASRHVDLKGVNTNTHRYQIIGKKCLQAIQKTVR